MDYRAPVHIGDAAESQDAFRVILILLLNRKKNEEKKTGKNEKKFLIPTDLFSFSFT